MGQEVKNDISCQSKYGLSDSSVKTGKFLPEGLWEQKMCTFLGLKVKNAISDGTPSHLHPMCSLYVCTWVQRSKIFKQNKIILICSRVIVIFLIWVSLALEGGVIGSGVSGVNNYSLYEFKQD